MSSSTSNELEQALRHFIAEALDGNEQFADAEHDHDDRYPEQDHEHDRGSFEESVEHYLSDFVVGGRCGVQRAFENAVRLVIEHWLTNAESSGSDAVRTMLQAVLAEARTKPPLIVMPVLTRCLNDLNALPMSMNGASSDELTYTRQ